MMPGMRPDWRGACILLVWWATIGVVCAATAFIALYLILR